MEYALDPNNNIVYALDAKYGIYFCPECHKPCGLRIPFEKCKHFYHFSIDPTCSLSFKNDSEYMKKAEIQHYCNEAIDALCKNTTDENWYSAINCLIRHEQLNRLRGCSFAILPLSKYLSQKINSENVVCQIVAILMDNDNNELLAVNKIIENVVNFPKKSKIATYEALIRRIPELTNDYLQLIFENYPEINFVKILIERYRVFDSLNPDKELNNLYIKYKSLLKTEYWYDYMAILKKKSSKEWDNTQMQKNIRHIEKLINTFSVFEIS